MVRTELGVTQAWAEKFGQALRSVGEDLGRLCLRGLQVGGNDGASQTDPAHAPELL